MIFSTQSAYQGEVAVQQIFVFTSKEAEQNFNKAFQQIVSECGISNASDSNLGALYKLRAVYNGNGMWYAIVRRGIDGYFIWEDDELYVSAEDALESCKRFIQKSVV